MGALLTGIFATRATGACGDGNLLGLLEGGSLFSAQAVAVVTAWGLASSARSSFSRSSSVVGLRVARQAETEGLDLSQHEEEGYIFI